MIGSDSARRVDVSVLLATRNRATLLEATLQSFRRQQLEGLSWEIVIVDNGSSDGTEEVIRQASAHLPIVVAHETRPGKNRALNHGLGFLGGDLVVFTDDDIVADPRWIIELHAATARLRTADIFAGVVNPLYPPDTAAWLQQHEFARQAFAKFHPPVPEGVLPDQFVPYGANFAVRRSAMAAYRFSEYLGPQAGDYAMGGESDFILRLRRNGAVIAFVPSAVVGHVVQEHQRELAWLFRRSFRLGRGYARGSADNDWPKLAGVPRFLWRLLAVTALKFGWSRLGGERAQFEAGIRYHRVRGELSEHWALARERRQRASLAERLPS